MTAPRNLEVEGARGLVTGYTPTVEPRLRVLQG